MWVDIWKPLCHFLTPVFLSSPLSPDIWSAAIEELREIKSKDGDPGNPGGSCTSDGAVALVPLRHPWLLLRGHVHGRLGVCGELQLEIPRRDQRVGALHLRYLHPHRGADVPEAAGPLPGAAALHHLHFMDVPVGVWHGVAAAPVQRLPLGLLRVSLQLHGTHHGRVRRALVLRLLHSGAPGYPQDPAAALPRGARGRLVKPSVGWWGWRDGERNCGRGEEEREEQGVGERRQRLPERRMNEQNGHNRKPAQSHCYTSSTVFSHFFS